MKKVLMFDYDGVIVDSIDSSHKIYNQLCEKYGGVQIKDRKKFAHLFDKSALEVVRQIGMPMWKVPYAFHDYKKALREGEKKIKLVPGIKKTIIELSKKHDIVIVTSNLESVVEEVLKKYGLKGVKSVIGSETSMNKIKKIKNIRKAFGKCDYYYVGDTKRDIMDGRKAKIRTVAVSWGYQSKTWLRQSKPDFLAHKPKDLVEMFNTITRREDD